MQWPLSPKIPSDFVALEKDTNDVKGIFLLDMHESTSLYYSVLEQIVLLLKSIRGLPFMLVLHFVSLNDN